MNNKFEDLDFVTLGLSAVSIYTGYRWAGWKGATIVAVTMALLASRRFIGGYMHPNNYELPPVKPDEQAWYSSLMFWK